MNAVAPTMISAYIDRHIGQAANATSVNSLTRGLAGLVDASDGVVNLGTEDKPELYSVGNLFQQARAVFNAREGIGEEAKQAFESQMSKLETAFADKMEAENFRSALKASKELVNITQDAILKTLPQEGGMESKSAQKKLLQSVVSQAEINAMDPETKAIDPNIYESELKQLLSEAKGLSLAGLEETIKDNASFAIEIDSFAALESVPDITLAVDHLVFNDKEQAEQAIGDYAKGDFSRLIKEDGRDEREAVKDLLVKIDKEYQAELERGTDPRKALSKAHSNFLGQIGAMNDDQKAYFAHLSNKFQELKDSEPSEFLNNLFKSLPNLVVPGILGAILALTFGLPVELFAMGAAAVSFLGGSMSNEKQELPKPPEKIAA